MSEKNVVGAIPEFTEDDSVEQEEVKKPEQTNKSEDGEKETPVSPPDETKPVEEAQEPERQLEQVSEDITEDEEDDGKFVSKEEYNKATQGLRDEIVLLRKQLRETSGTEKRTIEKKIEATQDNLDELEDLNPNDVEIVEKVLKAKGYITQAEAKQMSYNSTKQDILNSWLENHPEYKPENDVGDVKWNALQREVSLYKEPEDPRAIKTILDRSHRAISKSANDPTLPVKKQQLKTAGVGTGGVQRSSSKPSKLTDKQKQQLLDGGWSEEEISKMNK